MTLHPLTDAVLHLGEHPELWRQKDWICGTTACLAGRIILQAGAVPVPAVGYGDKIHLADWRGERWEIMGLASHIAGLTRGEAHRLFSVDNDLAQLLQATQRLTADCAIDPFCLNWKDNHHHRWIDSQDKCQVAAHRRSVLYTAGDGVSIIDMESRAAAHDLAGDIATARGLQYIAGTQPPEVSA